MNLEGVLVLALNKDLEKYEDGVFKKIKKF
jgi:hypothetical protein